MRICLVVCFLLKISFFVDAYEDIRLPHIQKMWDVDHGSLYSKSQLFSGFSPGLYDEKLIFGDEQGHIKYMDIYSKKIRSVMNIPMNVERSIVVDELSYFPNVLFYGRGLSSPRRGYFSVDIAAERINMFVPYDRGFVRFGEFLVFENDSVFLCYIQSLERWYIRSIHVLRY